MTGNTGSVSPPSPAAPSDSAGSDSYDFLWDATLPEGVETGVVPSEAVEAATPPVATDSDGTLAMTAAESPFAGERPAKRKPSSIPQMVVSGGQPIVLERRVIVGRSPGIRGPVADEPLLVAVPSPDNDISRNHLEVRLEGAVVLVRDLHSTNGTQLRHPGESPVRIASDAPTLARSGDVFDIGEGVTITFEGVL